MKNLLTLSLLFTLNFTYSQTKSIKGFIKNENKCPLVNVNISFQEKDTVFLTDTLGYYNISFLNKGVLNIKKYGYKTIQIEAKDTLVNLILETETNKKCIFDRANTKAELLTGDLIKLTFCDLVYYAKNYNIKPRPLYILNGQEVSWNDWKKIPKNLKPENILNLKDKKEGNQSQNSTTLVRIVESDTKFVIKGTNNGATKIIIK